MTQNSNGRATHIYLLKAGNHQKVGRAYDVQTRIRQLRTGNPFPITLAAQWCVDSEIADSVEQSCFREFAKFSEFDTSQTRRASEWYRLEAPIMNFLVSKLGHPLLPEPRTWGEQFGPVELFLHLDGPFRDDSPYGRLAGLNRALEQIYHGISYPRSFFIPGPRGDFWFEGYKKELDERMRQILKDRSLSPIG